MTMKTNRVTAIRLSIIAMALGSITLSASAQSVADSKGHVPLQKTIGQVTPTGPVPSLAVMNAAGAKLEDGKLILTGVSANSIVFADRPVRAAGHVTTKQFIMQWDEGKDSFAKNPPNATISVLGGDGSKVSDAVVTLKSPKYEGNNLTFDVTILEGNLNSATGPAALFIDHFAGGFGGFHGGYGHVGGFHAGYGHVGYGHVGYGHVGYGRVGYWHAPVYHGAWYAGAATAGAVAAGAVAAGAAAAYSYPYAYRPYCGYYPYPPCY